MTSSTETEGTARAAETTLAELERGGGGGRGRPAAAPPPPNATQPPLPILTKKTHH
ncbi:hypothetical protein Sgri01_05621 [Streptomyces griseus]